jgi:hypothetical protein
VTAYRIDDWEVRGSRFESRGSRILDFSISFRQAFGSPSLFSSGYPGALSPGAKGGKGVLLTAHPKYLQRSKDVDLYNRIPNTSIVTSCLTTSSTGSAFLCPWEHVRGLSDSRPGRSILWGRDSYSHWIRGCMSLRAGLNAVQKRRICIPSSNRTSTPWPSHCSWNAECIPLLGMSYRWWAHCSPSGCFIWRPWLAGWEAWNVPHTEIGTWIGVRADDNVFTVDAKGQLGQNKGRGFLDRRC